MVQPVRPCLTVIMDDYSRAISEQVIALKKAGCQTIFNDLLDHVFDDQSNLILALEYARAGDILVVWDTSTLCLDSQNFVYITQTL